MECWPVLRGLWKHYAPWKEPDRNKHLSDDSIWVKCPEQGNLETEKRLVVAEGRGTEAEGWSEWQLLSEMMPIAKTNRWWLSCISVNTPETHRIVHFKWVNGTACELHLHKGVFKKRGSWACRQLTAKGPRITGRESGAQYSRQFMEPLP